MPELAHRVGPRPRDEQRRHAAGRRRQGRRGRDHGRRRPPRRPPELPRPTLRIGFTPDEEIGEGATLFDVERFGASCAYTLDGSEPGEVQDETFTAAEVVVTVNGVDVHPGLRHGQAGQRRAPGGAHPRGAARRPHAGDDLRPGGLHPRLRGRRATRAARRSAPSCATSRTSGATPMPTLLRSIAEEIVGAEPRAQLEVTVREQYPNMRRFLDERPEVDGRRGGGDPRARARAQARRRSAAERTAPG